MRRSRVLEFLLLGSSVKSFVSYDTWIAIARAVGCLPGMDPSNLFNRNMHLRFQMHPHQVLQLPRIQLRDRDSNLDHRRICVYCIICCYRNVHGMHDNVFLCWQLCRQLCTRVVLSYFVNIVMYHCCRVMLIWSWIVWGALACERMLLVHRLLGNLTAFKNMTCEVTIVESLSLKEL